MIQVIREGHADAVAMADILHYNRSSIPKIRSAALAEGINVREV
jgi:cyclase